MRIGDIGLRNNITHYSHRDFRTDCKVHRGLASKAPGASLEEAGFMVAGVSFKSNRIKPPPSPVWHEGDDGHRAVGRVSRIAR